MSIPNLQGPLGIGKRDTLAVACDGTRERYERGQHVTDFSRVRVGESRNDWQIALVFVRLAFPLRSGQFKISEPTGSLCPIASNDVMEHSWHDTGPTLQERLFNPFAY